MVHITTLTEAERDQVTAAVVAAEAGTDGEIVTIVTRRSDQYNDVGLHYALAAVLLTLALAGIAPAAIQDRLAGFSDGWASVPDPRHLLFAILIAQTIVFLAVRYALAWMPLRLWLTPQATKARRVRRRAIACFKVGAQNRTSEGVGVLLYLSLDEHIAEIVADKAIHAAVPAERWGDAMAALVEEVRQERPGEGMARAVAAIGVIIAEHFPKTDGDRNELPDRLIEL